MPVNFEILLEKFLKEDLSPEELNLFLAAAKEPANEGTLLEIVDKKLGNRAYKGLSDPARIPEMFWAMLEKTPPATPIKSTDTSSLPTDIPEIPARNTRRIFTGRRIAAAAILLLAGAVYYFIRINKPQQPTARQDSPETRFKNDIAPGGNKAILTLSNGNTIVLDSSTNGILTRQGNTKVLKLNDGQLAYQPADAPPTSISYNTLSTPRGGQYQLTLPDGSHVWLNAASSIRYPTAFSGKERRVEITGEAYFEIAKNAAMPFKVMVTPLENSSFRRQGTSLGEQAPGSPLEIEVLGTSFNITAYDDDTTVSTTLLEGAVKVTKGATSKTITPGQQLITGTANSMLIKTDADIQKTIAWKNGKFIFYNDDIKSIMKQLTRWYDIDVHFSGVVNDHYTGRISRQVNISQVLKMMEAAGGVSFSVQGKEVKIN